MTPREFFYLVCSMRAAQRSYFKNRDQQSLRACKAIERDVDDEIARVKNIEWERENQEGGENNP